MNRRRPLRIAVLKPDVGVTGGFERVVHRIEAILTGAGHEVTRFTVDARPPRPAAYGVPVPADVWSTVPEYFPYLYARDGFDRLDTRSQDLVLSTQPPSFSHRSPRHLALFYHHHRVFYDLEDRYLAAGFAADATVHRRAGQLIRGLDAPRYDAVTHFLTPSTTVDDRLTHFNGRTDTTRFEAGIGVGHEVDRDATPPGRGPVLCVGRHEFPKRTELAVAAAHLLDDIDVTCIGVGGRLAWARSLDHRLGAGDLDPAALTDDDLWCNTGRDARPVPDPGRGRVTFTGGVSDDDLDRAYRDAPCVVAPAFDEDYGLTAIEAMAHGRPVVVCRDGGGLAELVDHETTGLVVDPTPTAVAAAVRRLVEDRDLAAALGANGRDRAAELSWRRAGDQLLDAVTATLDA